MNSVVSEGDVLFDGKLEGNLETVWFRRKTGNVHIYLCIVKIL